MEKLNLSFHLIMLLDVFLKVKYQTMLFFLIQAFILVFFSVAEEQINSISIQFNEETKQKASISITLLNHKSSIQILMCRTDIQMRG